MTDILALRTAAALHLAWALMMAVALLVDGDVPALLSGPLRLFLGAASVSLALSYRPGRLGLLHLVNATALLIAAALIGAVRVSLVLF